MHVGHDLYCFRVGEWFRVEFHDESGVRFSRRLMGLVFPLLLPFIFLELHLLLSLVLLPLLI